MPSSGTSSTSPASTTLPTEVIGLLQKIADKDAEVAAAMSTIIPEDHNEQTELKEQQRRLNAIRKVQTRIHKKEKTIRDKETQMQVFLQDIKSVTREWCPDQGGGQMCKGGTIFFNGKKWQNMANKIITNMLN